MMSRVINAIEHLNFLNEKPKLFPRIISGFFNKAILHKNILRTIDIAINYDCHFKCKFCSAASLRNKKKRYLKTNELIDLVLDAQKLGAIHVNFTGGEPLLRDIEEICEVIRSINPEQMLVSLVTNGFECTKDKISALKEAGLDSLQFSIESLDRKKHDSLRGGGDNWNKSMQFAEYAKSIGLNVCLNSVLFKDNFEEVKKLAEFCKEKDYFLTLNIASSVGNWKGNSELKVDKNFLLAIKKLLSQRKIRNDTSWNFNLKRGCSGGTERVYITAYGDVLTCPLVHVSYGNVLEDSLKSIHDYMGSFEFIKKWSSSCKHAFDKEYYEKVCKPAEEGNKCPLPIAKLSENLK